VAWFLGSTSNRYPRHVLFNAAFIARRRNPELERYFLKKTADGKHYFSPHCAVERTLVHLIYAVWTRGTPFDKR
jgi:transposase